ncbi:hypothetical protein [uncultured Methanobrevibacter sp.]|uniref:hypothetical protein n=1 Tax=uncultured Methanobrevibacter sp. TaxID=253161 RepID=UPI0025E689B9|nr:hypothetical protein [uncultured Methanobrevibacter sp.]
MSINVYGLIVPVIIEYANATNKMLMHAIGPHNKLNGITNKIIRLNCVFIRLPAAMAMPFMIIKNNNINRFDLKFTSSYFNTGVHNL